MDRGSWWAIAHGHRSCRVRHEQATKHVCTKIIWKCVVMVLKGTRHQMGKKKKEKIRMRRIMTRREMGKVTTC